MGLMKPEQTTGNQARLPMKRLGHQPSHLTLDPQFMRPTRYAGTKDEEEFEE